MKAVFVPGGKLYLLRGGFVDRIFLFGDVVPGSDSLTMLTEGWLRSGGHRFDARSFCLFLRRVDSEAGGRAQLFAEDFGFAQGEWRCFRFWFPCGVSLEEL